MGVDPLTIGLAIASGVSSIAGSQAQKKQAEYAAETAQQNQRVANWNAANAARAGAAKLQSEVWKGRGLLGRQTAAQAASGLDVNSGSAVDVRDSTAGLLDLGFGNVVDTSRREEYAYRAQATQFGNEAALDKASAPTLFDSLLGAATAAGGTVAKFGGFGSSSGSGAGAGASAGVGAAAGAFGLAGASYPASVWDKNIDWQKQFGNNVYFL